MRMKNKLNGIFKNKYKAHENISKHKEFEKKQISESLEDNLKYLQQNLKASQDIVYRDFYVGEKKQRFLMVYVEGMVDNFTVNESILKSMMLEIKASIYAERFSIKEIQKTLLTATEVREIDAFDELILRLLSGDTLIFVEKCSRALAIDTKGWDKRAISEPTTERNVKGPKDCFIESIRTNIVLIRRRIKDPNLAVELLQVGRRTKTAVGIIYLQDILKEGLAVEIKQRIEKLDLDGIVDSGQLLELIQDHKWTIFPQAESTERPDKVVSAILEGRAAIIVDGTPFVLLVPTTFSMYLDAPDDYYDKAITYSLIRLTRYLSFFISASLPGIYIGITNFHPGMLPVQLSLSITGTRTALPFPTYMEIIAMETVLELLEEAGVRLPQTIGQTVSIVGGIVIGQAAIQAGLVSPAVVIVVALTAIASFTLPSYTINLTSRMLRIPFIIAGTTLGFFGVVSMWLFVLIHMASLESFGVGYFDDFSPYSPSDLDDTVVRAPKYLMKNRPIFLRSKDIKRQNDK